MPHAGYRGMVPASTPTFNVFLQIVVWSAISVGLIMALAVVMM